jgi:hypothetical protein
VVNLPREERPWEAITWLAEIYLTSWEAIHDIGRQEGPLIREVTPTAVLYFLLHLSSIMRSKKHPRNEATLVISTGICRSREQIQISNDRRLKAGLK